jgi:hypothetical protein
MTYRMSKCLTAFATPPNRPPKTGIEYIDIAFGLVDREWPPEDEKKFREGERGPHAAVCEVCNIMLPEDALQFVVTCSVL